MKQLVGVAAALVLLAPGAAWAADAAHPEAAFGTLIGQGYTVVATMALTTDESTQSGLKATTPTVLVTLQKDASVAVCTFSAKGWYDMADNEVNSASICDYRSFIAPAPAAN